METKLESSQANACWRPDGRVMVVSDKYDNVRVGEFLNCFNFICVKDVNVNQTL